MTNKYNPDIHHRRSIRLKQYDYSSVGVYFVTICTFNRVCLFGEITNGVMQFNEFGYIVKHEWSRNSHVRPNIELDAFVVMPNHIHGILVIIDDDNVGATRRVAPTNAERLNGPTPGTIGAIVGQFKSIVAKRINTMRGLTGIPVWQRNYYEHIIRNEGDLQSIRDYIMHNPAKWEIDENNPINFVG